ncbi:hypothetical protein B0O80DRAFT_425703 [Mortierella sp. GBAus27b]|nr:hypothetical protein B0O80DRAFT_425703 [Mortierella sp. GBAus27b]
MILGEKDYTTTTTIGSAVEVSRCSIYDSSSTTTEILSYKQSLSSLVASFFIPPCSFPRQATHLNFIALVHRLQARRCGDVRIGQGRRGEALAGNGEPHIPGKSNQEGVALAMDMQEHYTRGVASRSLEAVYQEDECTALKIFHTTATRTSCHPHPSTHTRAVVAFIRLIMETGTPNPTTHSSGSRGS